MKLLVMKALTNIVLPIYPEKQRSMTKIVQRGTVFAIPQGYELRKDLAIKLGEVEDKDMPEYISPKEQARKAQVAAEKEAKAKAKADAKKGEDQTPVTPVVPVEDGLNGNEPTTVILDDPADVPPKKEKELGDMTKAELLAIAKEKGIQANTQEKKEVILEKIISHKG